ncbi:MAG TPA: MarP family serine protease [Thermoleophilaceae bacterium]|nr:MarP family serine protease [Thermoleophilaceae bacterium]
MTVIDWIIVVFTLVMAIWGYAQGLVVGALSLIGFLVGGFIGSRVGPLLLSEGAHSPYAPVFALAGAFVIGGFLASALEIIGLRLRGKLRGGLGVVDGFGGAVLLGCAGLVACWIGGAVALQTPGARDLRRSIQRSAILRRLNEVLPPRTVLNALARFDPFPQIQAPRAEVPPPSSKIARDPEVRAAGRSVVKVLGTACGLGIEGSGWVAERGVVVTNAHVVAGEDDTTVQLAGEGAHLDAQAIWFDSRNDVAILRVDGLGSARPLEMNVNAKPGTSGAVLGFPENGGFRVAAARLGATTTVITQDAYGGGPVRRRVTALRGRVLSGNSGGPLVDGRGRVLGTVFAATTGGGQRGGYAVPDSIVRSALGRADHPVDTGGCAAG